MPLVTSMHVDVAQSQIPLDQYIVVGTHSVGTHRSVSHVSAQRITDGTYTYLMHKVLQSSVVPSVVVSTAFWQTASAMLVTKPRVSVIAVIFRFIV